MLEILNNFKSGGHNTKLVRENIFHKILHEHLKFLI